MNKRRIPLNTWRRLSQVGCFVVFLFLFIKTDYSGQDEIAYAVNVLFRIDPFLGLCASLATRTLLVLMWPALVTVLLTLLLGRFFCGWACPMGALIDLSSRFITPRNIGPDPDFKPFKYYVLVFLTVASIFGLPAAGYLDPFSILVRGLALAVYPSINALSTTFFTFTYQQAPNWINNITEPVYGALKYSVLPFRQNYFELALLSFAILMTVLLLDKMQKRFFCRNVCPLGAFLAVLSKVGLLRGHGGSKCGKCRNCRDICRMGAIDDERNISPSDCNLCLDCVDICPANKISFHFARPAASQEPFFNLNRRTFIGAAAAGFMLPFFLDARTMAKSPDPFVIRPPGAMPERDFVGRCVRCGECMKVCIGNALQPAFLQAGIEGMFSPVLKARTGYCEYNCSLCGQVCPSGAIQKLAIEKKKETKIGLAFFDKNRCLPYAKGIPCIVCEEHCPIPDKAIQFREAVVLNSRNEQITVKQPYLVDERCIGCGICETKCPLPGAAAVRVTSAGESRNPKNMM
jgi:MauM/NapG family ferredoxin protein